ncbi:AraC family transcriptional regulator [Niastella vici]|uniref:AraC family transcriptional regulator n=1 Tax=Niastella vici TaxID=1703345 RepID=A0A1V9G7Q2_9BACT|nr:AraC family transcriptional regulator [Niastella vici]OQP66612.1 AraC family transcriptional regulator [Niastella vici]
MTKQVLPVYGISNLNESKPSPEDFMTDHFAHYLDEHKNLRFPHKHSFYQLVYFSKGSGSHSIDFIEFPVEAGQLYFMIPGQVHSWNFADQPDGFIVNFSEQYLNGFITNARYLDQFIFFSGIAQEQVITIPENAKQEIETTLEAIVREGLSNAKFKDDFARTALVQLFILVSRIPATASDRQQNQYNQVLLRNFQKLIEQHYKEKKLTKDYAAMLYITPNHLNALCKDVTGRPAGELIRDRVLLEAKRLLVNARLTIAQIATELEFMDNSYFSKYFKKYAGVTPEIFRHQHVKKNS